jgi:hypothetical protein
MKIGAGMTNPLNALLDVVYQKAKLMPKFESQRKSLYALCLLLLAWLLARLRDELNAVTG